MWTFRDLSGELDRFFRAEHIVEDYNTKHASVGEGSTVDSVTQEPHSTMTTHTHTRACTDAHTHRRTTLT